MVCDSKLLQGVGVVNGNRGVGTKSPGHIRRKDAGTQRIFFHESDFVAAIVRRDRTYVRPSGSVRAPSVPAAGRTYVLSGRVATEIHTLSYDSYRWSVLCFRKCVKWTLLGIGVVVLGTVALAWPDASGKDHETRQPATAAELRVRDDALSRARVLADDPFDAPAIDFSKDPNDDAIEPTLTTCRFVPAEPTGTTPKFDCELPTGEKIKVKYGWTHEIPAEIAATRLLRGLGFPADRMSHVTTLRCFGCVVSPFHVHVVMQKLGLTKQFDAHLEYDHFIDFTDVAVERKLKGESIAAGDTKGWAFYQLSKIDPARGGARRAEVDALRLMAMFLNHWDNKAQNQRLVCVDSDSADCQHPVAMIQDTGSDFGPHKMNLDHWWHTPVWADAQNCTLSMKNLPYGGGTFQDVQISEEGRQLLGDRLKQLSARQIEMLFTAAGFKDVEQWVAAFQARVRQVSERAVCPSERKNWPPSTGSGD
jgi:hypothetical protein